MSHGCGADRIAIKHLADADANKVDTDAQETSVDALRAIPVPTGFRAESASRYPAELKTYSVRALLIGWKIETDRDLHLVIAQPDAPSHTMIAESVDPACAQGPYQAQFQSVRDAFARCGIVATKTYHRAAHPVVVNIVGPGFFDHEHGQEGAAPNSFEIHPITEILSPDCPTP